MDIGKRVAEVANIVCALGVVYEIGDKKGWWPLSFPHGPSYAVAFLVIVACSLNVWALSRKSKPIESLPGAVGIPFTEAFGKGGGVTLQPLEEAVAARNTEIKALKEELLRKHSDGSTPYLMIEYHKQGLEAKLRFRNESDEPITNIEVGPLEWQTQSVDIAVAPLIPPLPGRESAECSMYLEDPECPNDLRGFMVKKTPEKAETLVAVKFQNRKGEQFLQRFILTSTASGSGGVVWSPCPPPVVSSKAVLKAPAPETDTLKDIDDGIFHYIKEHVCESAMAAEIRT